MKNIWSGLPPDQNIWSGLPPDLVQYVLSHDSRGMHTAGHLYGPHSSARVSLNRRMMKLKVLQENVRRNQRVQVALPGYPVNSRMNLEQIYVVWINDDDQLTTRQKQEIKRLLARAYTHKDDGYSDEWLFGSGPMANTWHNRTKVQRKAHRATLLAGSGNARRVNGHNLPLPLTILRKGRRTFSADSRSDKYPKVDGDVDETHDIFWPETRSAARKFLHRKPTLVEMFPYVNPLLK